jgi:hypothetical protein
MTDTATAAAETPVAPTVDTSSPPGPAPQETPANGQTPGTGESNAQPGSGAGDPAATPDGDKGESKEKPKTRFQERIDELTASRREAERRAQAAEQRAAELFKKLQPPGPQASLEEQDDYRLRKVLNEARAEDLQTEALSAKAEAAQRTYDTFAAKAEAVADRMPGLVDKFVALPEVTQAMATFVAESDKGAEVAFALANNPQEATRIARLSPLHQGIELARLEGRLSAAPAIRKLSTAPAPAPTVTGNPSPAGKTSDELSVSEMQAMFKKKGLIR